jgi:hypothetical protein
MKFIADQRETLCGESQEGEKWNESVQPPLDFRGQDNKKSPIRPFGGRGRRVQVDMCRS